MIRLASVDDARAIARTQVDGWHAAYRDWIPASYLERFTVEARMPHWQRILGDGVTFVAEQSGRVVGFCDIGPTRDDDLDRSACGEIYAIYVHPACWRNGVGSELCRESLAWFRQQRWPTATLWALELNREGLAFYASQGFAADGCRRPVFFDESSLMEMRLTRSV